MRQQFFYHFRSCFWSVLLLVVFLTGLVWAEPPLTTEPLADGTEKAKQAIATFRIPEGMKVELFAAEPRLASPVAICLDEQGRVYVAEEYRFNRGTEENRTRPFFLEDDLQIKTLEDRLAMYKKWAGKFEGGMDWFTKYSDQVRLLEDRDGDGVADFSSVFATNFNGPLAGLAAGLIARDGDVYLTCIPNLWLLRDTDKDGQADVRKVVHRGFGVNAAFLGHDLHGLVWGPDGKLYFSVGDRGFHVKTHEGNVLHGPRRGAVFRCEPDGSKLEVVHEGLRNPQELAFDQYGNLFAADNNCDKGDHSRLVYVVEGGNSGWNMAYQTISEPYLTGPWHAERIWHIEHKDQPAWIVPPVGKLGAGPSGFSYYPGTGLSPRYENHFFLCNYTGSGGVESFSIQPKGAGFEIIDEHDFFKPLSATDVEFGYDGKMYVSDFVGLKWDGGSVGGRIYTLHNSEQIADPVIAEVGELFQKGFNDRPIKELAKLLHHSDMRVRQRAQFAIAKQGEAAVDTFEKVAESSENRLARLHAIWGLGQVEGRQRQIDRFLIHLLKDTDPEVRAQAAKVIGWRTEKGSSEAAQFLVSLLSDPEPRVRFFATVTLGKLKYRAAVEPIFEMLAANNDKDRFLRHAGVIALLRIGDVDSVLKYADSSERSLRIVVLLILRRLQDPRIAMFLNDADPYLVTEAARAINDVPIDEATKSLGHLISGFEAQSKSKPISDALARRVINANFRIGESDNAELVADLVASKSTPTYIRQEALGALIDWSDPSPRDRVNGFWRPLSDRDPVVAKNVVEQRLDAILANTSGDLLTDVVKLIVKHKIQSNDETFFSWISDSDKGTSARVAALRLLSARKHSRLDEAIETALKDNQPRLRAVARDVLATIDAKAAFESIEIALADSDAVTIEKQDAFRTLSAIDSPEAQASLIAWTNKLADGELAPEIQLDLFEAASKLKSDEISKVLGRYQSSLPKADKLARYRISLVGGDAERGRALFTGHRTAQCIRCHKIKGAGGTAGPELSKTLAGKPEKNREYLLLSLIDPNAKIMPGFGSVALVLDSGKIISGTLKSETEEEVTLLTAEGKTLKIPVDEIDDRTPAKSAMPTMRKALTLRELRDLIEYLSTLNPAHSK